MYIPDKIPNSWKCENPMLIWYLFNKCGWLGPFERVSPEGTSLQWFFVFTHLLHECLLRLTRCRAVSWLCWIIGRHVLWCCIRGDYTVGRGDVWGCNGADCNFARSIPWCDRCCGDCTFGRDVWGCKRESCTFKRDVVQGNKRGDCTCEVTTLRLQLCEKCCVMLYMWRVHYGRCVLRCDACCGGVM